MLKQNIENKEYEIIDAFLNKEISEKEIENIDHIHSKNNIIDSLGSDYFEEEKEEVESGEEMISDEKIIKKTELNTSDNIEVSFIKYEAYCEAIWCDGVLNESEANWLDEKRKSLNISKEEAKKIQKKVIKNNITKTPDNHTDLHNYNFNVILSDNYSAHDPHYIIELSFEKQGCLIILNKNNFIFSEKDFSDRTWMKPYVVDGILKFYYNFLKTKDGGCYFEIKTDLLNSFSNLKISYSSI